MWASMELGQKITVWGLAVMLACGAAYIALASTTLAAVPQSGGASLGDLGSTRVIASVSLTLASAAGTSLMALAITDRHEQAARTSIAGVGSSVSLIACIAWAGLSLASSEAGACVVYISTDYVFDGGVKSGEFAPYQPTATPMPLIPSRLKPVSGARHMGRKTSKCTFEVKDIMIASGIPENLTATGLVVQMSRGPKLTATKEVDLTPEMKQGTVDDLRRIVSLWGPLLASWKITHELLDLEDVRRH